MFFNLSLEILALEFFASDHSMRCLAWILTALFLASSGGWPLAGTELTDVEPLELRPLAEVLSGSTDVRWASESSLLLAVGREGVVELSLAEKERGVRRVLPLDEVDWRRSYAKHVAQSSRILAYAPPYDRVGWRRSSSDAVHRSSFELGLEHVLDLDVFEDRLLIVGGRRGPDGTYLPGGTFAWFGNLEDDDLSLDPVYYSSGGVEAPAFRMCGPMQISSGRFLPNGNVVIVPGIEPDIFLYSPEGRLLKTWDTGELGIDAGCKMTYEQKKVLTTNWSARHRWLNERIVVDEVLPFPEGPALVLRRFEEGSVRWKMLLLSEGKPRELNLPIRSESIFARLRGDVSKDKLVLLVSDVIDPRAAQVREPAPAVYVLPLPTWD